MKKLSVFILVLFLLLCSGCSKNADFDIVATTLPVYDFTSILCQDTGLAVGRLVTESVSCLHDYSLQVSQMRMLESADAVVISGAGLENFLDDALHSQHLIDASEHLHLYTGDHDHDHNTVHDHAQDCDPHIWLSPVNAQIMATNIYSELCLLYPQYQKTFQQNLASLKEALDTLQDYGNAQLSSLPTRELITFHDGFAYFAESFDLTILESVEEESGSEASAAEIIHLAELVRNHSLPAIFIEKSGSTACANIIQSETGVEIFTLDMAMAGNSYFEAMYHNIDTIKEALG